MKRILRIASLVLALLAAAVLLVYFSAGSWLETSAGRNLLQSELGKALGVQAELLGEYALELFPGLQIAGQHMELSDAASGNAVARLENYELHLALRPLLRKQVVIHKVAVSNGFVDLDQLASQPSPPASEPGMPAPLPSITSLQIRDVQLRRTGQVWLDIDRLELEDFVAGQDVGFSLGFSPAGDEEDSSLVELEGSMVLSLAPMRVSLDLDSTSIRINDQVWPLGAGQFEWSGDSGDFNGSLAGHLLDYASSLEIALQTAPSLSASLAVQLLADDQHHISGSVSVRELAGLWVLDRIDLNFDDQQVVGQGCLELDPEMTLQLQLNAPDLDLDALQALLPANFLAGDSAGQAASEDLALEVAVELLIERASISGAIAHDVRLLLGQQPDCGGVDQVNSP